MLPFSQITGSNTFTTGLGAVSLKGATTVDASFLGFHDVWGRGHWSETWGQGKQPMIVYSIWYHSSNLTWPVGHHVEMGPFTSQSRCLCATLSKSCTMICVAAIHKISTDRVPPKEFDSVRSSRGILGPFVAHFISSVAIWHLTFQVFWKQCSSWNLRLWTHVLKSRACFHSCPKQVHIMLFMMLFEKVHAYIYIYILLIMMATRRFIRTLKGGPSNSRDEGLSFFPPHHSAKIWVAMLDGFSNCTKQQTEIVHNWTIQQWNSGMNEINGMHERYENIIWDIKVQSWIWII